MLEKRVDIAVIGAGPAGLAAAASARKAGGLRVLVIERDTKPGGILQQCIHAGFGLSLFQEELTGPEYARRLTEEARAQGVDFLFGTAVLEIAEGRVTCLQEGTGVITVETGAIILAMGCRERTRANIRLPGTRPAGIYTAGAAQRLINRQNRLVGKKAVILGSGDIGMIMARRLTLEGAQVLAVVEIMDYLAGLTRNRVQCLDDFHIPLYLSHTVTAVEGEERVTGVRVARVDENRRPIPETEWRIPCDTLLLSVGLIPENELSTAAGIRLDPLSRGPVVNQYLQTELPSVFACGNVLHVNDLADNVSLESARAGRAAADYVLGRLPKAERTARVLPGENVRTVCPQRIEAVGTEPVPLYFRVKDPAGRVTLRVRDGEQILCQEKRLRVSPGEMEHIRIRPDQIAGETLRLDVIRGDEA